MKPKSLEIFIPGPAGRLEAKYYKNPKFGSPVAIVLHPHPQYGGTMNNRIVQLMYNIFLENGFSVIKVNFRGVGKSEGVFDNGQGELSDAAAALDWIERQNLDYSQCWVSGFSFGSLICMQLIMRRPVFSLLIAYILVNQKKNQKPNIDCNLNFAFQSSRELLQRLIVLPDHYQIHLHFFPLL